MRNAEARFADGRGCPNVMAMCNMTLSAASRCDRQLVQREREMRRIFNVFEKRHVSR